MSAPMRHWVAASGGDLHSLALRDISPRAADGRVTGPMSLPMTRACGDPMVAQTLRTLASPAGHAAQPSAMGHVESLDGPCAISAMPTITPCESSSVPASAHHHAQLGPPHVGRITAIAPTRP
ncbi:hypothetical protein XaclCFBP3371_17305 [Xanthomonas euvesicatoria pv. citrumelonis]|nr:hypothetical protein XaclCFBP3371_17305 [Xanthomonas euvesicatoria pv. citrumelonis]